MSITISLCMIAKNEEKYIKTCIKSALPLVDEVIVVDTGSTDDTISIINSIKDEFKSKDIKIIESVWENDFSKARNTSIKDVKSDWILVLDADEFIEMNAKELKLFLEKSEFDIWNIPIFNYSDSGAPAISTVMPRLFRNNNPSYEGEIHEVLLLDGKNLHSLPLSQDLAKIHHVGYRTEVIKEKNKGQRNLKILRKQVQKEPNVSIHRFYMGRTYMEQEKYKKALDQFIKWSKCEGSSYHEQMNVAYDVSICLIKLKRYKEAEEYLINLQNNESFSNQAKLYNIVAELYENQKKYDKVFMAHNKALVCGVLGGDTSGVSDDGIGSYYTILLMAKLYDELNDDRAIHYFINGTFHKENKHMIGKLDIVDFLQNAKNGEYQKYLEIVKDEIVRIESGEFLIVDLNGDEDELIQNEKSIVKTISNCIETGDLKQAKNIIKECEDVIGFYPILYSLKGVIAMIERDNVLAALYFSIAQRFFPDDFNNIYNLAFLYESLEIHELAAFYYYEASVHSQCPLSELEEMHNKVEQYRERFSWFVL